MELQIPHLCCESNIGEISSLSLPSFFGQVSLYYQPSPKANRHYVQNVYMEWEMHASRCLETDGVGQFMYKVEKMKESHIEIIQKESVIYIQVSYL